MQAGEPIVCGRISARGGAGGDLTGSVGTAGPGGGGGVSRTSARGACDVDVAGGASGSFPGDAYGAEAGAPGRMD